VTVNVAIDRRAQCRVESRARGLRIESKDTLITRDAARASDLTGSTGAPLAAYILRALGLETGFRVVTHSRVPAGSGLGGSSALAVAIAAALARAAGRDLPAETLWPLVRDAEAQCIGVPTGIQDYLAALYGGVLAIHLEAGGVRIEKLSADTVRMEECLLLVDAGATRFSGINNWEVFKARIDGDARVRDSLARIASVAGRVREALVGHRYADVAPLVAEEWEARKSLAPAVTTPEIDRIAEAALAAGGAAKVCGAGGGGMVAVWATPGRREQTAEAIRAAGFEPLSFGLDARGLALESGA
jgi:D-glycero-alpha-D-manno-heptose-7-phosphate kinase